MGEHMCLVSMTFLNKLFIRGNTDKTRRVTADRAHIDCIADVIYTDWYEQSFCTETKIKAFFSAKGVGQVEQINKELQRLASGGNVAKNITNRDDDAYYNTNFYETVLYLSIGYK